jgi:hypothetical protein
MAAKSLAIVPQNLDAMPQISLIQRTSQTRKSNTQISDFDLAQEGSPGFGNCAWNPLQTANAGRIVLYGTICPYRFPRIGVAGKCSSVLQPRA